MHGIAHAKNRTYWIKKLLYVAAICGGMTALTLNGKLILETYFSYPVETSNSIELQAKAKFPAVTVCVCMYVRSE